MGRIRTNVVVDSHNYWALFDSGARNTYIIEAVASSLTTVRLAKPELVSLGGKTQKAGLICLLTCTVNGLPVHTHARVLKEIGKDEEGKEIEILIGALTMQEWGIRPILDEERLDMSHYPKEFVEFL